MNAQHPASGVTSPPRPGASWLLGPVPDLLFGCGVGYLAIFALLTVVGPQMRDLYPIGLLPLVALALSTPHYGATLLRVYERREDRERYRLFTVYLSALIGFLFIAGVYNAAIASVIITVYLTWSPWHYSGQNYGIAMMFLGRRGVRLEERTRRYLRASFYFSFALTVVEAHVVAGSSKLFDFNTLGGYHFVPVGLPEDVQRVAVIALLAGYLTCLVNAAAGMLRAAPLRTLIPTLLIVLSQAIWFVVPMLAQHAGWFETVDSLSAHQSHYAFFWIAMAHAVQYLWVTSYFAIKEQRSQRVTGFYLKALLWGAAIWGVPALLFAPDALGDVPFDAGLSALIAAAVNIHHFVLDGAIWKLRDGRVARILLRSVDGPATAASASGHRLAIGIGTIGAVTVLVAWLGTVEYHLGFRRAVETQDIQRAQRAHAILDLVGRESGRLDSRLALMYLARGDGERALALANEAVTLERSEETLGTLASVLAESGDLTAAIDAMWQGLEHTAEPSQAYVARFVAIINAAMRHGGAPRAAGRAALERLQARIGKN